MVSTIEEQAEEEAEFERTSSQKYQANNNKACHLNIGTQIRHRAEQRVEAADAGAAAAASRVAAAAAATVIAGSVDAPATTANNNKLHPNKRRPEVEESSGQPQNYLSSLITRSSIILNALKQQYSTSSRTGSHIMQPTKGSATTSTNSNNDNNHHQQPALHVQERQQANEFGGSSSGGGGITGDDTTSQSINYHHHQQQQARSNEDPGRRDSANPDEQPSCKLARAQTKPALPPLPPPPPPRDLLRATASVSSLTAGSVRTPMASPVRATGTTTMLITSQAQPPAAGSQSTLTNTQSLGTGSLVASSASSPSAAAPSTGISIGANARRHAIQEQSLERDAALSLKARDLKHKRTSSIKSALRHANLGSLRGSHANTADGSGGGGGSGCGGSSSSSSSKVKSMPYELFEPPVTQRTFQRSKRRGAMASDPKRQMSADTIGLRQLTDEYLKNAGVKPMSSSGQCSLVALTAPSGQGGGVGIGSGSGGCGSSISGMGPVGGAGIGPGVVGVPGPQSAATSGSSSSGQSQFAAIETQFYQASKRSMFSSCHQKGSSGTEGSMDSLSTVAIYPGNLPWQSDVSVQCEILQAPQAPNQEPPYETTGDILNTIAGPFRGAGPAGSSSGASAGGYDGCGGGSGGNANHLSATLKRGLTVISQHHLTSGCVAAVAPATALNVVGSLKKSLSNTLDISRANAAAAHHLHSQDSLPAYSNLLNEPESPPERVHHQAHESNATIAQQQHHKSQMDMDSMGCGGGSGSGSGLIGQLASKLGRQSSKKKFSVSRKGLQRALSFDCRGGYKRLEGQQHQPNHQTSDGHRMQLLSASNHQTPHNRSTMCLDVINRESPRPYLPQSASQVDFQLPLLPYHKMQEAIVSQRLIGPAAATTTAATPETSDHNHQLTATSNQSVQDESNGTGTGSGRHRPDADELICGGQQLPMASGETLIATTQEQEMEQQQQQQVQRKQDRGRQEQAVNSGLSSSSKMLGPQKTVPPRLVLDIPTIATPTSHEPPTSNHHHNRNRKPDASNANSDINSDDYDDGGEEVCAIEQDDDGRTNVIVCLPSPNVAIGPGFNLIPNSTSFCIDPNNQQLTVNGVSSTTGNTLNANDIFSNSKCLIKRPSTMLVSDTMNQVAQALNNTGSRQHQQQQQHQGEQVSVVLRNRRQAIVPPKLATDGSNSDGEQQQQQQAAAGGTVGKLVDVEDAPCDQADADRLAHKHDNNKNNNNDHHYYHHRSSDGQLDSDEATVRALRRKRSGGGAGEARNNPSSHANYASGVSEQQKQLSSSQMALPTFCIQQDEPESSAQAAADDGPASSMARQTPEDWRRPDSQATNADSIVSSGSSLSLAGKRDFTVTSPGGLTVSFGSSRGRRRSSIAVIPQMQICPGDLLVYSKQLIDRMNQSDETEPPQFLTIDDKKAKNIWSSFKLFDNRTLKARNELLCSLEDVLASLQPSTFVDEQLSHYKGMLWNEFLYETESRRSASSEILSTADDGDEGETPEVVIASSADEQKPHVRISETTPQQSSSALADFATITKTGSHQLELQAALGGAGSGQPPPPLPPQGRETLKATMSSGPPVQGSPQRSRDPGVRSLSSRFREKPKLKRGQTVDSVFRIPLIPSSPLKHAQQHQQTPTAHLEEHALNEDDERSSTSAASVVNGSMGTNNNNAPGGGCGGDDEDSPPLLPTANRKNRSSSTRSRAGSSGGAGSSSRRLLGTGEPQQQQQQQQVSSSQWCNQGDSSFETDDAMDLIGHGHQYHSSQQQGRTPHQIVRQSSLSTLSSTITRTEQKRQRALWDLFQSECTFFFDHLLTLKNVYMEPLKKIQVEGFAMFADPDVLFGNLDELCCGVYDFCKEFLYIIMRTLKTRPEELNATDVLIKLYKKNPKIDHLRGVYHRYTLNYINALTYLESLRRQVEFVEFEKWSSRDVRCKKLQLTDLLVAPVQHIMRVPIILKDIESHTENHRDRDEIRAILAVEEASLRELDDKMRWLKNFERLLEIQKNICWPSVLEQDFKLFIPEFLKEVLSKQPCEKLIVSPRRQIVHEGTLSNLDLGKACDMHVILFDDMLLLTRRKKGLTKKPSTVCKTNSGGSSIKDDGSFKYIVYKQPLSLDRFYVHDVQQVDAQSIGLKHLFLLIVMNRFQQITFVHSFSAPNDDIKQTWLFKIKKTSERWKKNFSTSSGEQPEIQQHQQQPVQQATIVAEPISQENHNHSEANSSATSHPVSGQQQHQQQQQQYQYQPLVPKVVNLSAAMRQVTGIPPPTPPPVTLNQEQPAASRLLRGGPTEAAAGTMATMSSPIKGLSQRQQQQAQSTSGGSLSNFSCPLEAATTKQITTIERAASNNHDYATTTAGGRDSRAGQRYHQNHQNHNQNQNQKQQQQQPIELVVTSASGNSHDTSSNSTNVSSSLAPAH